MLFIHVEDLQDVASPALHRSFKSHNVLLEVHDRAIDFCARSANDVELIEKLNDSELRGAILVGVPDGDVPFGLEVGDVELEELGVEAEVGEVLYLSVLEGGSLHSN